MLIVLLPRKFSLETIKLVGASRRHVALHPAAISTRARSFHRVCEQRRLRTRRPVSDRRHSYRDLHLVEEVANCMIIAAASIVGSVCPPRQLIEGFIADWLDYRIEMVSSKGSTSARPCSVPQIVLC